MKIKNNSLCKTCSYSDSCILTSNKKFIWSCSEYEEEIIVTKEKVLSTVNF